MYRPASRPCSALNLLAATLNQLVNLGERKMPARTCPCAERSIVPMAGTSQNGFSIVVEFLCNVLAHVLLLATSCAQPLVTI